MITTFNKVLEKHGRNPWFRTAVLSSRAGSSPDMLKKLIVNTRFDVVDPWKLAFIEEYSLALASRNDNDGMNSLLAILKGHFRLASNSSSLNPIKRLVKKLDNQHEVNVERKEFVASKVIIQ